MILGKITGKATTLKFKFKIENNCSKYQYIQVMHKDYGFVLCQIIEIERSKEDIASCIVIGYNKNNKIFMPRNPFEINSEVLDAQNDFIKKVLSIEQENPAYIGKLENRDIKIHLDLNKLLSKHIAIIAKTGAGKSYTAGILVEEIMEKKVPLLIIDPHGEYSQMALPTQDNPELLEKENIKPKGYKDQITEYGNIEINEQVTPILLNDNLEADELMHILPAKLTQSQKATLYSTIKELNPLTLNNLIESLNQDTEISSINLISILDYLNSLKLFSSAYTPYNELVKPGKCSIINLKGIPPEIQEIIVYKLLKDLFQQRKLGNIAPFFTIIEESHNFSPERSFGETKSSSIIRTIASEGRKFGLGLCVVTQRPARLDKNVLSQCSTQIILKVTNPNDLKSISNSVEHVTSETEDEIKNLPIGTALVAGVVDLPLLVKIRPRRSKHGGDTINILEETQGMLKDLESFEKKEILPIIFPKTTPKDLRIIEGKDKISPMLIPSFLLTIEKNNRKIPLLVERIKGHIVTNIDMKETTEILKLNLSKSQKEVYDQIIDLKKFSLSKLNDKTGKPILKLKDFLEFFIKNKIIDKKNNNFELTNPSLFIRNPEKFRFLEKIEFRQIAYKGKLNPKVSIEAIKRDLPFEVIDSKDCFIVYYKID